MSVKFISRVLPSLVALLFAMAGCTTDKSADENGKLMPGTQASSSELDPSSSGLFALANPMQGTDSQRSFSHGNLYPAIALPFPMNVWAPYTQPQGDSFYYQYDQKMIRGIRQTHQPSPWIGDYANFSLMPVSGKLVVTENDRASTFSHQNEIAQPSYYKVHLDTWNATAEVTPTLRGSRFRFTFEKPRNDYVVLDVFGSEKFSSVEILPSENKIIGIARNNHGGVPDNFGNYFVIQFDQPFSTYGIWSGKKIETGKTRLEGRQVGAFLGFAPSNKIVTCKVASSFISPQQADLTLQQEIGNASFDAIRTRAEEAWNDALGRIQIKGGSPEEQRTFYSAFYRSILFPHRFYEMDANNQPVYFSPFDGNIHQGYLYTDSGYWDTFRAAHPFYNLLFPEISAQIIQGLISAYRQSGRLPEWPSPGHRKSMIGQHAFSLLADAWMKGVTNFDAAGAVAAMLHDANSETRTGGEFYNSIGYIPYSKIPGETSLLQASSMTIEYSYDDFCAAQLAHAIGDNTDASTFLKHTMNYTNVYDTTTGFMRGRRINGAWDEPFFPDEWGGPFTEGGAWQWTFNAMQDEPGLENLMGGEKAFANKLDSVFAAPPTFRVGTYGQTIHEMTEMVALNMGQYSANNEPDSHLIYLYDYIGQPWKAQVRLRQAMTWLYQATPDGMSGDDDTGQMSAWYVLSALGLYAVCPGDPHYLIGSPLFDQATLHLSNGKTFTITANHNGPQEFYIQSAALDGQSFDKTFISHKQIMTGGELEFEMGSAPNYEWGVSPESRPPSPLATLQDALK